MTKLLLLFSLLLPFAANANLARELLNQSYGEHERQIFDLWIPQSDSKTPLVIYIHGGGWSSGSKDEMRNLKSIRQKYNDNGIAIAAINYRFLKHVPLQTIMREDIAGFIQFMRFHSDDYNIDRKLIMPYGISAGGSASLWLATHDDIADPHSTNPILRESSRVFAAGHFNAQVSYDYFVWYQFLGKENTNRFMGDQVWTRYHFQSFDQLTTEEGNRVRADLNMYGNMTSDDAPIIFYNTLDDDLTKDANHFIHSPNHTRLLSMKAKSLGLTNQTYIRADGDVLTDPHTMALNFFIEQLETRKEEKTSDAR
jgi:acetyl esterase